MAWAGLWRSGILESTAQQTELTGFFRRTLLCSSRALLMETGFLSLLEVALRSLRHPTGFHGLVKPSAAAPYTRSPMAMEFSRPRAIPTHTSTPRPTVSIGPTSHLALILL